MKALIQIIAVLTFGIQANAGEAKDLICSDAVRGHSIYSLHDVRDSLGYELENQIDPLKDRLSPVEEVMVLQANDSVDHPMPKKQLMNDFLRHDGTISYYRNTESGQLIAIVISYPGDNSSGGIFEIVEHASGKIYAKHFASIGDDDIGCF